MFVEVHIYEISQPVGTLVSLWTVPETKIKQGGVLTVSYRTSNPPPLASYRAVGCALFLCLHVPSVWQAAAARLLQSRVDDMCCQLTGEDSLLRYRLFPAWLGTEWVTGQGVCWNTVFSSAAAAVQLQYSRNIVLLCGCFPRPALNFTLNALPLLHSGLPPLSSLSLRFCLSPSAGVILKSVLHVAAAPARSPSPEREKDKGRKR